MQAFALAQLSLVAPTDTWTLWAVLLSASAFGISQERTRVGAALSAPVVTTLTGLLLSNLGVIPTAAPAYDVVNGFLLPFSVPLLLFGADLRRVVRDTGRLLIAFLIGAAAVVGGTMLALWLFPQPHLGDGSWKMAAALCSRHIGGAVNYVACCSFLQVPASLVAAGLAADNLVCAVYFSVLFALAPATPAAPAAPGDAAPVQAGDGEVSLVGVAPLAYAAATSASICAVSVACARAMHITGADIPVITALVVFLATVFPRLLAPLAPAGEGLAKILLQTFFAVVGASGSVRGVLATAPALFLVSGLQVAVHLGVTLWVGSRLGFTRPELLIASNANVGGPTTAAGMATAKGWRPLLVPAILLGVLGYATATFTSIALGLHVLAPIWRARTGLP